MTRRGKRNYRSAGEFDNGVAESTGGTTGRRISRSEGMKVEVDNGAVKSSIDVWSDCGVTDNRQW